MKVLIISHNPMSQKHSIGKTLMSFFSEFKKDDICQLYIHNGVPDSGTCKAYYQMTDKDVLKGVYSRKVNGKSGSVSEVSTDSLSVDTESNDIYQKIYSSSKRRNPSREILRDIMWSISPWYNQDLKDWLDLQKPTCIFAAIGSGKFLYEIAVRIAKDYQIPLYTYVCDDFYSMTVQKSMFGIIWKRQLVRKTKELMKQSSAIVTICQELSDFYSEEFKKQAVTLMTGTNYKIFEARNTDSDFSTLRYFGKLSINRYKSLAVICRKLDMLNEKYAKDYSVEIFCGGVDREITDEFHGISCARFFDFITGKEFEEKFFSSDALIHIEAFDAASVDRVKFSVSTKIADSLASGIPLLAYAPESVASMKHLIRNQCAFTAVSEEELTEQLDKLITDSALRAAISQNAVETAKKFHDPHTVSMQLYELLRQSE